MFYLFKSKSSFNAAVSKEAMETCEHILSEMGAELHDDLIQKLSVFRLYLDRLDRSKSDQHEIKSLLVAMNVEFQEVAHSVRRISRRLQPVKMSDESFQKEIAMLCQNLERPGGGTIHFDPKGPEQKIPEAAEIYILRIIQELIHNALKHSSAWHIWVRLTWTETLLSIEVEDDGTAFSRIPEFLETLQRKNNTLRMRTNVLGAKLHYQKGQKGLLAKVDYVIR
ncbi:hypothetical protein BH09BAC3_BH09BAC3_07920 [soil metagenome]